MKGRFDFLVVVRGDRDPGPDPVRHKSSYYLLYFILFYIIN